MFSRSACLLRLSSYKRFFCAHPGCRGFFCHLLCFSILCCNQRLFDLDCGRISNAGRPSPTQSLSQHEYLTIGFIFLAFSLLFAYWASEACIMIMLLFVALYFLYSAPPLRLKRFFPFSAAIIGIQALLAFLAGASSLQASATGTVVLSPSILWLIFISFFLSSNIKDLKDADGDRRTGILAIPVLLGEGTGRKAVAFLVFLSYCLVHIFWFWNSQKPRFLYYLSVSALLISHISEIKRLRKQ